MNYARDPCSLIVGMLKQMWHIIKGVIQKSTELCDLHYKNNTVNWIIQSRMSLLTGWMDGV
jgi:hypothetical protein